MEGRGRSWRWRAGGWRLGRRRRRGRRMKRGWWRRGVYCRLIAALPNPTVLADPPQGSPFELLCGDLTGALGVRMHRECVVCFVIIIVEFVVCFGRCEREACQAEPCGRPACELRLACFVPFRFTRRLRRQDTAASRRVARAGGACGPSPRREWLWSTSVYSDLWAMART